MNTPTSAGNTVTPSSSDLELARRLHRSLLPTRLNNAKADVSLFCREYQLLGGDYGTAYWQDEDRLFLCVCDVTGHGIASALLAARINTFVRLEVEHAQHPCEVVVRLNNFLTEHFAGLGIFATFFCAVIDWGESRIHYAGAGHPPALLKKASGRVMRLASASPMLGIFENFPKPCRVAGEPFQSGDMLLLYTDGFIESTGGADEQFWDIDGLEAALSRQTPSCDAMRIQTRLLEDFEAFTNGIEVDDDLLLLCACLKIDASLTVQPSQPSRMLQ